VSLKAFHVLFITVSTLFSAGFGLWSVTAYQARGEASYLGLGVFSFLAAVTLVVYGGFFLKKMKGVSYL
jgi:hypothetical protein